MRKVIATVLLCLLALVAPIPTIGATNTTTPQEHYTTLARWAGCRAEVITSDEHSIVESFYNGKLYIGTMPDGVPAELAEMVALHEIGHCLQDQAGVLDDYAWNPQVYELDADRRAADLACARHKDGAKLLHDLFVWAYETYGYSGDYAHGTMAERISQSTNAPACHPAPL